MRLERPAKSRSLIYDRRVLPLAAVAAADRGLSCSMDARPARTDPLQTPRLRQPLSPSLVCRRCAAATYRRNPAAGTHPAAARNSSRAERRRRDANSGHVIVIRRPAADVRLHTHVCREMRVDGDASASWRATAWLVIDILDATSTSTRNSFKPLQTVFENTYFSFFSDFKKT